MALKLLTISILALLMAPLPASADYQKSQEEIEQDQEAEDAPEVTFHPQEEWDAWDLLPSMDIDFDDPMSPPRVQQRAFIDAQPSLVDLKGFQPDDGVQDLAEDQLETLWGLAGDINETKEAIDPIVEEIVNRLNRDDIRALAQQVLDETNPNTDKAKEFAEKLQDGSTVQELREALLGLRDDQDPFLTAFYESINGITAHSPPADDDVQSPINDLLSSLLGAPTASAQTTSTLSFYDTFSDGQFSNEWSVISTGYTVSEGNGRLEMTVREQYETLSVLRSQTRSATFNADSGVDASVDIARKVAGPGWVSTPELRIISGSNPDAWVGIRYNPWNNEIEARDSSGNDYVVANEGLATGYHNFRLVAEGDHVQAYFDSYSVGFTTYALWGAGSYRIEFRDQTGGSSTGYTETSARDNLWVYTFTPQNTRPGTAATPGGSTSVDEDTWYTYNTYAYDPDGDSVRFLFDWDDGSSSWTSWVSSGSYAYASHYWSNPGTYYVRALAYDSDGPASSWSNYRIVTVNPTFPEDIYEQDDTFGSARTWTLGTTAQYQSRTLAPTSDYDYVRFYASPGNRYYFWSAGSLDTYGTVYTPGQGYITADDDDGSGLNFYVYFEPTVSGYHYLAVRGYSSSYQGYYTLYGQMVELNDQPYNADRPSGPDYGYTDQAYSFALSAVDPNGDNVRFLVDWGDGTTSYTGYVGSGQTATATNTWSTSGPREIRVKAQDTGGMYSPSWSSAWQITLAPEVQDTCYAQVAIGQPEYEGDACSVILLHGWQGAAFVSGDVDEHSMNGWDKIRNMVGSVYDDVRRTTYYGDSCGVESTVLPYGSHNTWYADDHVNYAGCDPSETGVRHDLGVDIRHLSYHFAWFLHEEYERQDAPVDIIAHSMGGLVMRYALEMVDRKQGTFPSTLTIEDVVTLSTPHGGGDWCEFGGNYQAAQMCSGSSFMRWLDKNAHWPQASSSIRTEFTLLGSFCDAVVSHESSGKMSSDFWILYADDGDCPGHSDFYTDDSPYDNDVYYVMTNMDDPGQPPKPKMTDDSAPHPVKQALQSVLIRGQ